MGVGLVESTPMAKQLSNRRAVASSRRNQSQWQALRTMRDAAGIAGAFRDAAQREGLPLYAGSVWLFHEAGGLPPGSVDSVGYQFRDGVMQAYFARSKDVKNEFREVPCRKCWPVSARTARMWLAMVRLLRGDVLTGIEHLLAKPVLAVEGWACD